jgi:hypothetical protein
MWHRPSFTLEIDCRYGTPPQEGDLFTLSVIREEKFMVTYVAPYTPPINRPDGTVATHHIRYIRKPRNHGTKPEPQNPDNPRRPPANTDATKQK